MMIKSVLQWLKPAPRPPVLWNPAMFAPETTRLAEFARFAGIVGRYDTAHYAALHRWSVEEPAKFWATLWDFLNIKGERGLNVIEKIRDVPWARFFPDSRISYTENLLAHATAFHEKPAIIARVQDGPDRVISWSELYQYVSVWEQALSAAGVREHDHVAVYLPNIPESIIILLAASQLGAVFVSAGMEMGADDMINRLGQVHPKVLITADGYTHGAKHISRLDVIRRAQTEIPSVQTTIMIPFLDFEPRFDGLRGTVHARDFLAPFSPRAIQFVRRDFNHPLYVLFSSGSTGKPKCFEHSTGGVLLKHLCEWQLHCDVRPGDRVFYHATPSWMMWDWLASGLASGATLLMYDGSPTYPDVYAQWNFTAAHGCTHHGTAAPVILGWLKDNANIAARYDLAPLRMIMSTGAVLPAQGFEFIHRAVKADVKIASISGGTDIVGCFLGGNAFTPTYAGQVNGPILGMDVAIWDESGHEPPAGQAGELVCRSAFPSMPLRFLGDDGTRYRAEYFDFYTTPHTTSLGTRPVWRHGDSVLATPEGQFVIIGRSDATLNQNGVRIGPVAIYDQLKPFANQIREAAAIDFTRPDNKQAITILFLVLGDASTSVPEPLAAAIKKAVKDNVTPYAIPTEIIAVPGVLKTPNGKIAEVVMKKIINGASVSNASLYGEDLVKNFESIGRALARKYG